MEQMEIETAKTKRMNQMLILITIIFGICWFPSRLMQMVSVVLERNRFCLELWELTKFIVHVVAMSSACYNPFLYGLMNSAFKTEYSKLCSCAQIGRRQERDQNDQMENVRPAMAAQQVEEETPC